MELKHVDAFLALAEDLHFGKAAKRLGIAQPVLSQSIKAFEADLGVDLFERTTRSVALTPAGEAMIGIARELGDKADELRRIATAVQEGRIGRVRVGFAGGTGYALVFQLAKITTKDAHNIVIDIQPQTFSKKAIEQLRGGDLDLAVVTIDDVPDDLGSLLVKSDRLIVALSDLHPLADRKSLTVEDLRGERMVAFPESSGSHLRSLLTTICGEAGFEPKIVQDVIDPYSLVTVVGANVGLALMGESSRHLQFDGVRYISLEDVKYEMPVYLAWKRDRVSPSLRLVLELAASHFDLELPDLSAGLPADGD